MFLCTCYYLSKADNWVSFLRINKVLLYCIVLICKWPTRSPTSRSGWRWYGYIGPWWTLKTHTHTHSLLHIIAVVLICKQTTHSPTSRSRWGWWGYIVLTPSRLPWWTLKHTHTLLHLITVMVDSNSHTRTLSYTSLLSWWTLIHTHSLSPTHHYCCCGL